MFTPTEDYVQISSSLFLFLFEEKIKSEEVLAYSIPNANQIVAKVKKCDVVIAIIDTDPALKSNPRCFINARADIPSKG